MPRSPRGRSLVATDGSLEKRREGKEREDSVQGDRPMELAARHVEPLMNRDEFHQTLLK